MHFLAGARSERRGEAAKGATPLRQEYIANHAIESRDEYEACVRAFFAFCRLVRCRHLLVQADSSGGDLLPSQRHRLQADYFALRSAAAEKDETTSKCGAHE